MLLTPIKTRERERERERERCDDNEMAKCREGSAGKAHGIKPVGAPCQSRIHHVAFPGCHSYRLPAIVRVRDDEAKVKLPVWRGQHSGHTHAHTHHVSIRRAGPQHQGSPMMATMSAFVRMVVNCRGSTRCLSGLGHRGPRTVQHRTLAVVQFNCMQKFYSSLPLSSLARSHLPCNLADPFPLTASSTCLPPSPVIPYIYCLLLPASLTVPLPP